MNVAEGRTEPTSGHEDATVRTRRKREPAAKLGKIVAAARDVFAQRGYHATTIHEICTRAGVSVGSFYSHFDDKREVMSRVIEDLAQATIPATAEWNFADQGEITRHMDDFFADAAGVAVWHAWRQAVLEDPELASTERQIARLSLDTYATAVRRSRLAAGESDPSLLDPEVVAWAAIALFRANVVNPKDAPPHNVTARILCELALGPRYRGGQPR